jgi:antitoxin (DNA-binding transcriptional repressor) of toxin-antitoxin stability system
MTKRNLKEISAGEFKQTCLALMDKIAAEKLEYIVTKRGKPVAKIGPVESPKETFPIFGSLANQVTYHEEASLPVDEKWNAEG